MDCVCHVLVGRQERRLGISLVILGSLYFVVGLLAATCWVNTMIFQIETERKFILGQMTFRWWLYIHSGRKELLARFMDTSSSG